MLGVADLLCNLLQMMMLELCWAVLSAFGNECTTMGERRHVIGREDETRLLCCLKVKTFYLLQFCAWNHRNALWASKLA